MIGQLSSGGAERVLCSLANHMAKKNEVEIITFAHPASKPFYPLDKTISIRQLGIYKERPKLLKRLWGILVRLIRLRFCLRSSVGPVVSFMTETNIAVLCMSLGCNRSVVIAERTNPFHHKLPLFVHWLRLITYRWAKKLVVQTPSTACFFPGFLQNKISTIPNPVQKPSTQYSVAVHVKRIVTIGRMDRYKDHTTLIKAFAQVVQTYPALTLHIYGEGPERKNLEAFIKHLHLGKKVFLPGVIKDVEKHLAEADLFIFPSQYEGFPNALCEAMAVGVPTIASACSGNVDVVRDQVDGLLFPVGDQERLEQLMVRLIENRGKRKKLSSKAKEVSDRFSAERVFDRWEKVIDDGA